MMNTKAIGWFSLSFISVILILLLYGIFFGGGAVRHETVEQLVKYRLENSANSSFSFLVQIAVSLILTLLFASFYHYCKEKNNLLATIGVIFIPAYIGLVSIIAFLHLSVMAKLIELYQLPEYEEAVTMILNQFLPGAGASAISRIGNIPYALLGISALIFGWIFTRDAKALKVAGYLIMFNGLGYLSGLGGIFGNNVVTNILNTGGVLAFIAALIIFCVVFLFKKKKDSDVSDPIPAQT